MVVSRTALVDDVAQPLSITREERSRVEPEARKRARAKKPSWRIDNGTSALLLTEPIDLVRVDRVNNILKDPRPLVFIQFGP